MGFQFFCHIRFSLCVKLTFSHILINLTLLAAIGGPFCGLFWSKDPNQKWLILAFKGTSPTNFSEFMVDATISHQNARSFFGNGSVHQGFYTSLIPGENSAVNPYGMQPLPVSMLNHVLSRDAHCNADGNAVKWQLIFFIAWSVSPSYWGKMRVAIRSVCGLRCVLQTNRKFFIHILSRATLWVLLSPHSSTHASCSLLKILVMTSRSAKVRLLF